jgi:hypothetical protein
MLKDIKTSGITNEPYRKGDKQQYNHLWTKVPQEGAGGIKAHILSLNFHNSGCLPSSAVLGPTPIKTINRFKEAATFGKKPRA